MRVSSLNTYRVRLNSMLNSQSKVNELMMQVSSGKKYSSAADNPVVSNRVRIIGAQDQLLDSYQANNAVTANNLSLVENTIDSMLNILNRVEQLQKQAANGTLSDSDRSFIVKELDQSLDELVGLANTKDMDGKYIFSGFKSDLQAYTNQNGQYVFQGDEGQRIVTVGTGVSVASSFSADEVFEGAKSGNGTFTTTDGSVNNLGSASIDPGSVVDPSAYVDDNYTISFVQNGSGDLAYSITGATSGQVVPALPGVIPTDCPKYVDGQGIGFNGMNIVITGTPALGDDFGIQPSTSQNIFNSINDLVTALKMPTNNAEQTAKFITNLDRAASSISQGSAKLLQTLGKIGSIQNTLENEININEDLKTQNAKTLSLLEDLDPVEAISSLMQEMNALESAQMTYKQIQNLSLFNYL